MRSSLSSLAQGLRFFVAVLGPFFRLPYLLRRCCPPREGDVALSMTFFLYCSQEGCELPRVVAMPVRSLVHRLLGGRYDPSVLRTEEPFSSVPDPVGLVLYCAIPYPARAFWSKEF